MEGVKVAESALKRCGLCGFARPADEPACRICGGAQFSAGSELSLPHRLVAQDRWQDAFAYYEDAVVRDPANSDACLALAWLAYAVRDFRAVEVWAHESQRQDPSAPHAHILLGIALKSAGRWEESIQEFDAALSRLGEGDPRRAAVTAHRIEARGHLPEWW